MAPHLFGQKVLQLERAGHKNSIRYYIGDEITFQLRNDETGWYTRIINDIDVDGQKLIFPNIEIHIDSIAMLRRPKSGFWRGLGTALQSGGGGIILTSVSLSLIQNTEFPTAAVVTGASSMVVGTALKQWKYRRFKLNERRRLRTLDLTFYPIPLQDKS